MPLQILVSGRAQAERVQQALASQLAACNEELAAYRRTFTQPPMGLGEVSLGERQLQVGRKGCMFMCVVYVCMIPYVLQAVVSTLSSSVASYEARIAEFEALRGLLAEELTRHENMARQLALARRKGDLYDQVQDKLGASIGSGPSAMAVDSTPSSSSSSSALHATGAIDGDDEQAVERAHQRLLRAIEEVGVKAGEVERQLKVSRGII
jgi:hypothetical protein